MDGEHSRMSRFVSFLVGVLLAIPTLAAAQPADPVSEGAITDTCRDLPALPQQACDTVRSATHGVGAICRRAGAPEACTPFNGQEVSRARVEAHATSPTAAAHDLQRRLQEDTPLRHATFVATHNSYNSYAYRPTPSRMDANQTYSLTDQLDMDVRRLELDVHTWTDVTTGQQAPILCHATDDPRPHTGCTAEMTLTDGLVEIDAWLDAHPDEIVMLRVETHLDGAAGYDQAAAAVTEVIGDHLFLPPATGTCTPLDLDLTRADVRDAGAQVMVISDCGQGSSWQPIVWDDDAVRVESTVRAQDFSYPTCAGIPRTTPEAEVSYDTRWIRFYDDATLLSSMVSLGGDAPRRATPTDAREWTRCGVNQPAFDHLTPTDGRLAALVWTWAEGEGTTDPVKGCAAVRATDGLLQQIHCVAAEVLPELCRTTSGTLTVMPSCAPGTTIDVPRNGHEAQLAAELLDAAGEGRATVSLRLEAGRWAPAA